MKPFWWAIVGMGVVLAIAAILTRSYSQINTPAGISQLTPSVSAGVCNPIGIPASSTIGVNAGGTLGVSC